MVNLRNPGTLPRRPYGKSGDRLSIIGFGGIVVSRSVPAQAERSVAWAIERGVNYFDVAPSYGDAEEKLGPALAPYRKGVFLACKTTKRQRKDAEKEFRRSLKRLRTDYFDLYQLHAIMKVDEDVDAAFAKGGVMEFLMKAKQAGHVRHIGFSAHTMEAALAALERYDFDSVLMPLNFAAWYRHDFGPAVIAKAREKGASCLALKMLARQAWPEGARDRTPYRRCWYQPIRDPHEAELATRFTLSLPITAAVTPGHDALMRLAVTSALNFKPITQAEERELQALSKTLKPLF